MTLPSTPPAVTAETAPFWDAAAAGRMRLPRCTACGTVIWYPRAWCPDCRSHDIEWFDTTGHGTIYSHTILRRGAPPPFTDAVPYVLAYVELAEGPRVLTNIVTDAPDTLRVGQPVELTIQDGIPRFRPS